MDSTQEGLETVVRTLASQPSEEQLVQVLRRFQPASSSPTSPVASVIFAIVNTTLPELWRSLQVNTNSNEAVLLVIECLSSVAGVNALLMRLDQLHNQRQQKSNLPLTMLMEDILEVLTRILEGKKFSPAKFIELCGQENTKAKLVFNEYSALVGGSKILNIVSKTAADLDNVSNLWIADGKRYSKWLGERLGIAIIKFSERPEIAGLIVKALSLGYPCIFLKESQLTADSFIEGLFPQVVDFLPSLAKTIQQLPRTRLLIFTKHLLQYFSTRYFNYTISQKGERWWDADRSRVGAVAGVLHELYRSDKMMDLFVDAVKTGNYLDTLSIQRAAVLATSKARGPHLDLLTDYLLGVWADKLFITRTPVSAQEAHTQILLISLAHTSLSRLKTISTSVVYNEGLSNRLSASVDRVRFLGMIIGESISAKVDVETRRLKFKVSETEDPSAAAWRTLIEIDDDVRPLKDLQGGIVEETVNASQEEIVPMVSAEEFLVDDADDIDSDLKSYPAPESDAEDSDDDPTLVSREKTPTPLYIRELMKYLQADNYNKVNVGLKSAPQLIRHKAAFGTELFDQAHDLARILLGLQDTYEMEEFQELRQSALIALVASAPEIVVAYLVGVFFTGDISIQQRCILLSAIGIGARELAGIEKADILPPQLLPPALHQQYISPMDQLSQRLEATMIEPIRDAAVTKLSGPKILQVRRFSSIPPEQRRLRTNVNMLSKVAGSVFVFPLLGRWWIHRQDQYGLSELRLTGSGGRGVHFEPIVLSTFIRTVGVIVYASAPSALDLRQMCKEYWDLLLSLRSASIDPSVAEAILFGMLVVLEITEPRVAAENFPKQVVETQAWAAELFQGLDEGKTKMLAGGILLKTKEIVSKHERLLLGDIISFGSISSAPMGLNLR